MIKYKIKIFILQAINVKCWLNLECSAIVMHLFLPLLYFIIHCSMKFSKLGSIMLDCQATCI